MALVISVQQLCLVNKTCLFNLQFATDDEDDLDVEDDDWNC